MKSLILALTTALMSVHAHAQKLTDYNFMLEGRGSIRTTCQESGANRESKLNLIPITDKATATYTPVLIKLKLCIKTWGYNRANITVNLPSEIFNDKNLLAMLPGQTKTFANIPSTRTSSRMLTLQVVRQEERTIQMRGGKTAMAVPFQISWLKTGGNAPEYTPMTVFVVPEAEAFSGVKNFDPNEHLHWGRVEMNHYESRLRTTLEMRGQLGIMQEE